jgi:hypothetical protein
MIRRQRLAESDVTDDEFRHRISDLNKLKVIQNVRGRPLTRWPLPRHHWDMVNLSLSCTLNYIGINLTPELTVTQEFSR